MVLLSGVPPHVLNVQMAVLVLPVFLDFRLMLIMFAFLAEDVLPAIQITIPNVSHVSSHLLLMQNQKCVKARLNAQTQIVKLVQLQAYAHHATTAIPCTITTAWLVFKDATNAQLVKQTATKTAAE